MSKKASPVPRPALCWYFRDRGGHRFGPYADAKEIRAILTNHCVGRVFEPAVEGWVGLLRPATEFIMEDAEYNAVCPDVWLKADKAQRRAELVRKNQRRYGHHAYRCGPVAGVHKARYGGMWRTPNFGRKIRDTRHGCLEGGEPPIRTRLRVRCYAWDDFPPRREQKSWKQYRRHQWRE